MFNKGFFKNYATLFPFVFLNAVLVWLAMLYVGVYLWLAIPALAIVVYVDYYVFARITPELMMPKKYILNIWYTAQFGAGWVILVFVIINTPPFSISLIVGLLLLGLIRLGIIYRALAEFEDIEEDDSFNYDNLR